MVTFANFRTNLYVIDCDIIVGWEGVSHIACNVFTTIFASMSRQWLQHVAHDLSLVSTLHYIEPRYFLNKEQHVHIYV
jgi:hypothetical protein